MKTPDINAILRASPVSSKRGAPMGARSYISGDSALYLQRINMVDGAYAPDGTYWGAGSFEHGFMFCAFNDEARVYVRAKTRAAAMHAVLREYPDSKFFRRSVCI